MIFWAGISFFVLVFLISFKLVAILLSGSEQPQLQLRTSNVFTLAIFSDLHFGEEEHGWGIDQDVNSTRVMNAVLDAEGATIDLVVLNGDLITGENTFKENSSDYLDQIVAPMRSRNIPWASTYGNHDSKFNLSREAILQAEKKFPLSITQRMDTNLPGVTNYYLIVRNSHGGPVAILWFFDSRGGSSYQRDPSSDQDDIPNWVADETAQWFTSTSQHLRSRHGPLPSMAFIHIPPHSYLVAQQNGLDPARFPGLNEDVPVSIQGAGHDDDAFVKALGQEHFLHSIYVGHDHGDAWCGIWPARSTKRRQGPFLCFSKHTGYGGYGEWDRGSRIIQLSFEDLNDDGAFVDEGEMTVETWVRIENGDISTRVTLNETYGIDDYA